MKRLHIYLNTELRTKFAEACKARGWKMSTVLQKVIERIIDGSLDPFQEVK